MAKYTVTRACGHVEEVVLFGKIKDREWRLENVEPNKLCYECWQKELAEQREKENREAAEAAREMNLPQLTGTEKQVAWAETIRQKVLANIDTYIYKSVEEERRNDPKIWQALEHIRNKTEARWWIDNREIDWSWETMRFLKKMYREAKEERMAPLPEVIAEAKAEATVRPESPKTETVAEIRALDDSVEIVFPEKRDDFRELVKMQLKMKWDGKWVRKLSKTNGTPEDRAAEAGHRILAAGFPIRIYDQELRARAVAGEYEPECTNWVMARIEGKYEGWFAITWDRQDDYYKAARAIGGSRWSKPSVVVPPEKFEEVLDFAERYGFKLSSGAQELVEAARKAKENALVAKVDPPEEKPRVVASDKPPVLEVPTEVGIDDEFKD